MTELNVVDNSAYKPNLDRGASVLKQFLWYYTNVIFFKNAYNPFSGLKVLILRMFGAKIGKGVIIKPSVNIKFPWKLIIGNHSWIGENVWIDNLYHTRIGSNVTISQGALLLCGNHDYTKPAFDSYIMEITLEDGVWIGARSVVTGGAICKSHSVLSASSLISGTMEPYTVYRGNPAVEVKKRVISKK